jgi:di/tricarboxylate transporter
LAAVFFISGKVCSDLVALNALILLMLFGILMPGEALRGFSSSIVVMMIGLFVVGGGIFQTGLTKLVSSKLLQLAGANETTLLIVVMLVAAVFSTMVSNCGGDDADRGQPGHECPVKKVFRSALLGPRTKKIQRAKYSYLAG